MAAHSLAALAVRRPEIRAQWEALLRTEPIASPLGQPDTLVHLIDPTLDGIFAAIARAQLTDFPVHRSPAEKPTCPCGRNPLLAFFIAGDQALLEALILVQAAAGPIAPVSRDLAFTTLDLILKRIAVREVDALCSVCLTRRDQFEPEAMNP